MSKPQKPKFPFFKENFYTSLALFFLFLFILDNGIREVLGVVFDLIIIGGAIASGIFLVMLFVKWFQKK